MPDDIGDEANRPASPPATPRVESPESAPLSLAEDAALGAEAVRGVQASRERRAGQRCGTEQAERDRLLDAVSDAYAHLKRDDSAWSNEIAERQATGAMLPPVPPAADTATPTSQAACREFGLLRDLGSVGDEFLDALPETELRLWHVLPLDGPETIHAEPMSDAPVGRA